MIVVTMNDNGAVVSVAFNGIAPADGDEKAASGCHAVDQLDRYFRGELTEFDLEIDPEGTAFEKRVWNELRRIPFGSTTTYGEIAARLGDLNATRAVGTANASNPIAIVIPCHRVIGADGELTGYAGGLHRKRWLLAHEAGQQNLGF
jgi:methylated-DNA-[protein]-cysteine S-methyltransferase